MGLIFSQIIQLFPPQPKFGVENVPNLSGKVMIVTGANTGVGYEIAKVRTLFYMLVAKELEIYRVIRPSFCTTPKYI
jgi:hypothetical protein